MTIVQSMITKQLPYIAKNDGLNICMNNLISRCFISLYSEALKIDVLRNIWDIFFMYGHIILFRTFQFVTLLLCDKKYENPKFTIEKIHQEILDKLQKITDTDLLNYFLIQDNLINDSYVNENRKRQKDQVYKQNINFKESIAGNTNSKMECDLRTPYCVYNNEINNIEKFNEVKIFRIKNNTKCYENYFTEKIKEENKDKKIIEQKDNSKNETMDLDDNNDVDLDDLDKILIERHKHVCTDQK